MKAKSIKGKSSDEVRTALQEVTADGFKPTLAIGFISVKQDRKAISDLLREQDIDLFGVTTHGEFIDTELLSGGIAMLLLDINRDYFQVLSSDFPEKNYREVTTKMAREALRSLEEPAFLIAASNLETDAEQLLFGFEDVIGKNVNVSGGMAGDDFNHKEQFVFTHGWESNRGVLAIALDESKVKITSRATCGWKAMGTEKTVTRSEGNKVYTIDGMSALDITRKYSGIENLTPENENLLLEIATNFPLQLQREQGEPVMRPGLRVDWQDGSFICSGTIPQGSKVRFSLPPDFDVIDKVVAGVEEMKDKEMPEADAVILFSCAGRILSLGPLMSREIEGVQKVWDAPMAGMFSNAELGRATGGNLEMHNLTTCCVALKEK
jgi:hypothetical protein